MIIVIIFSQFLLSAVPSPVKAIGGQWRLLQENIGVLPMHMQLLHNDKVIMFDRTDFGPSNLSLPDGKCRMDPDEVVLKVDCTAHSVEYDVESNSFRPLTVQTDVWCSSGAVMGNGVLVQTGGFNDGERRVRIFRPYPSGSDWEEVPFGLAVRRWYPTSHVLPDGRQIIIGGRRQHSYEFYPKFSGATSAYSLRFLAETNDRFVENNLYPFVFLNVDGSLFIFANNRAILFDYKSNRVLKVFPAIPGEDPRCYPSTGSAVLLPLMNLRSALIEAEVMVCGGAPKGSFKEAEKRDFVGALDTCGRMKITDPNPKWVMETMPVARVMGDMILLPNGNVLIINGAGSGTAGWDNGRDPVLNPVIYRPNDPPDSRFDLLSPTTIPRLYHSTAILLRDGRILVGGSNPHIYYNFTDVEFPTELRLEAFSPPYLDSQYDDRRPKITFPNSQMNFSYGAELKIRFSVTGDVALDKVSVTMVAPSFNTHSFSMSQRLMVIGDEKVKDLGDSTFETNVIMPGSSVLAPSGYYLVFVVHRDIPSKGIWVRIL